MTTSINVKVSGRLEEHLKYQISESGMYDNTSEYIRELIRKDLISKKGPRFKTAEELNEYLIKLATSPEEDFVEVDLDNFAENAYKKLQNEAL